MYIDWRRKLKGNDHVGGRNNLYGYLETVGGINNINKSIESAHKLINDKSIQAWCYQHSDKRVITLAMSILHPSLIFINVCWQAWQKQSAALCCFV